MTKSRTPPETRGLFGNSRCEHPPSSLFAVTYETLYPPVSVGKSFLPRFLAAGNRLCHNSAI